MKNLKTTIDVNRVIAIYPGRFQIFGRHHYETYKYLCREFGKPNVYITTSDKTNSKDSPFNFDEKRKMMSRAGVEFNKIIKCANVHAPKELIEKLNETVAIVIAVSKKDKDRFVGKSGDKYYFQPLIETEQLKKSIDASYIYHTPHFEIKTLYGELCSTLLRERLPVCDKVEFKELMGYYDLNIHNLIKNKIKIKNEKHEDDQNWQKYIPRLR